jgi:L-fuconolactonase
LSLYARMPLARGVRRLIQGHVDEPGWCLREPFLEAVQLLAKYNLHFEVCIKYPQLPDVTTLARRCPNVRFVLNHLGKPDIKKGSMEVWSRDLREFAKLPNTVCKISGAITEADHARWSAAQVIPYVRQALNIFGFDRVMFGGDWPVLTLAADYLKWVALVDETVQQAKPSEKEKLYRLNAKAFYRI